MDCKRKEKIMHEKWNKLHFVFIIMIYIEIFLVIQLLVIWQKVTVEVENLTMLMLRDKIILFIVPVCIEIIILILYEKIKLSKEHKEFLIKVENVNCKDKSLKSSILYIISIFIILIEYIGVVSKIDIAYEKLICYIQCEVGILFLVFGLFKIFIGISNKYTMSRREKVKEIELIHMSNDLVYITQLLEQIKDEGIRKYLAHELYTYATRATFYKRCHYIFALISLGAPAMATAFNTISNGNESSKIIVSILSLIATVSTGITGIVKFRESWIRYRSYCEILKREVTEYVNCMGDYVDDSIDKNERLISFYERLQERIECEEAEWKELRSSI